jgi:hypothetical protein
MLPATAARAWQLIDQYAAMLDDASIAERAGVYMRIMLVWWVVRLTRLLYEGPRDLDVRLADRSPGWESEMIANRQRYLELATAALDGSI